MVIIRLSRSGSKKRPFYNIVVTDSRNRRDGRFNERLGFYNPMIAEGPQRLTFNEERVAHWVKRTSLLRCRASRVQAHPNAPTAILFEMGSVSNSQYPAVS